MKMFELPEPVVAECVPGTADSMTQVAGLVESDPDFVASPVQLRAIDVVPEGFPADNSSMTHQAAPLY